MTTELSGVASKEGIAAGAAATAWAGYTNANGGIDGHKIDIKIVDTKGDPATMQSALRTLVETDKVSAIIQADTTAEDASGAYLSSKNIPVIGAAGYDTNIWSKLPNFYSMTTTIPQGIQSAAQLAKAVGAKGLGAVVCAEITACKQAGLVLEPSAKEFGLKYAGLTTVAASAPDYSAECLTLKGAGADAIFLSVTADVAQRFMTGCQQQGFTGTYEILATSFDQAFVQVSGAKIAGNLYSFPWWSNDPRVQAYRSSMAKYSPKAEYRESSGTAVWAALELFKKAIGTPPAAGLTPADVTKAYDSIHDETLNGLLPEPLTFTAGKPAPKIYCFYEFSYKPGAKNPVSSSSGTSGNGTTGDLRSSCVPKS